jgi:signal transduction histidine kinase
MPRLPPLDPALRSTFEAESRILCRQGAVTACLLAITLVPAFGLLDRLMVPEQATFFLEIRLACVALVAVILMVLRRPFGTRHALGLGVCVTTLVGLTIVLFTVYTGGDASPYYAGVNSVLVAVTLLMPWPPRWALLTAGVLGGAYVTATLASGPVVHGAMFVNNLAFIATTAVIAVVATALRERLRMQEFANRTALAEALRHKSEFMAKMSHELRTPLHVMIGYSDILLDEALADADEDTRGLLRRIRGHAVRLHSLISDLLDYAKAEAGKMLVHAEPVHVEEIVALVAEGFRPLTERKGLDLVMLAADDVPAIVSDRHRLEQILTNLVGNAVKFTDSGRITIEVRAFGAPGGADLRDLTVLTDAAAAKPAPAFAPGVAILVRDTGLGIRPEDVARLAADFEQLEGTSERYGGTGLGLSISKKLAGLLGGRLAVGSRWTEGSTFALLLPAEPSRWREAA